MKNLLLFGCFLLAFEVVGQSVVSGKVLDFNTNENLNNATIKVFKHNSAEVVTGGLSDLEGDFRLDIAPGDYDIEVSNPGYVSQKLLSVEVFRCKTPIHEVRLKPHGSKS